MYQPADKRTTMEKVGDKVEDAGRAMKDKGAAERATGYDAGLSGTSSALSGTSSAGLSSTSGAGLSSTTGVYGYNEQAGSSINKEGYVGDKFNAGSSLDKSEVERSKEQGRSVGEKVKNIGEAAGQKLAEGVSMAGRGVQAVADYMKQAGQVMENKGDQHQANIQQGTSAGEKVKDIGEKAGEKYAEGISGKSSASCGSCGKQSCDCAKMKGSSASCASCGKQSCDCVSKSEKVRESSSVSAGHKSSIDSSS
jgi:ribosome modulation factor